ncbi:FkbM family methyltransferase [Rhizobium sp. TH2]|uniref:FkbM family methyltransferase n=1 Tax=Rhizobium sp. TH2 TaxID=2775403 RepID=UPI002157CE41|nr:FkbM family methyltransferase [Rhizobium sp. TH2]UVC09801.1 FkbM family methyltransferase [Rhizobium sp. TH2]
MAKGSFSFDFSDVTAHHEALGYRVDFYLPERAAHRIAVREFAEGRYYEPFTHLAFRHILEAKGRRNAVHAGAFFGDMLHTLSKSAGTVYAFEPVLENFVFAKKNAERLGLNNVVLFNAGLGEATSLLPIRTTDKQGRFIGGGSSFDGTVRLADHSYEMAPVFRIDDLPVADVALIELDVEGFELPALKGARQTMERDRPVVLIEDNKKNCADFLTSLGYSFVFSTRGLNYWSSAADAGLVGELKSRASELGVLES